MMIDNCIILEEDNFLNQVKMSSIRVLQLTGVKSENYKSCK